jgi:hemoglobin
MGGPVSIYDQIGGTAAVAATVEGLYDRVLGDAALAPYFDDVPMDRQKRHMRAFITMALGGATTYAGRDMATAHAGLEIGDREFDLVALHLAGTLAELGVPAAQSEAVLARIAPLRAEIVGC